MMTSVTLPSDAAPLDEAAGRRSLIRAAITLAAQKRSFQALGLREVAREAGVNPNTFYRHFADMEELAMAVATELGGQLSQTLKAIRAGDSEDPLIYGEDIIVVDQSGGKTAIKSITDALRGIVGFRTF